ncbi:MAG: endonuclease III [Clostridia bacterium]|nr:endonuclease III [Clostridia bacterium]
MARESKTAKITRAAAIVDRLKTRYPAAECALEYKGEPWRLLVMGRLSAQCTDARVNIVCRELFERFPSPAALAEAPIEEIEYIVRPCGLYHTKARNIKDACALLTEHYGGVLPDDMDTLLTFPGVGRKIANLLLGDIYHRPAIVADTHCIRISGRLGLVPAGCKDPTKVELSLVPIIAPEEQSDFCHRIVWFGREICTARSPKCDECPLRDLCPQK